MSKTISIFLSRRKSSQSFFSLYPYNVTFAFYRILALTNYTFYFHLCFFCKIFRKSFDLLVCIFIKKDNQKQQPGVSLEISQNSQENICARVPILIKLQACNFIKIETWHGCFPVNFAKFLRTPFLTSVFSWEWCEIFKNSVFNRSPLVAASE